MKYVFQLEDAGVPDENSKGCLPAFLVLALVVVALVLIIVFVFPGVFLVGILALTYYFFPISLAIFSIVVVLAISRARRSRSDFYRCVVVDEAGVEDRFRAAIIRFSWTDIEAVTLTQARLEINFRDYPPARYRITPIMVDGDSFARFCRNHIVAAQRS